MALVLAQVAAVLPGLAQVAPEFGTILAGVPLVATQIPTIAIQVPVVSAQVPASITQRGGVVRSSGCAELVRILAQFLVITPELAAIRSDFPAVADELAVI